MVTAMVFNNISVISWQSVLWVEENGVPGKKPSTYRISLTNFIHVPLCNKNITLFCAINNITLLCAIQI
jgi:hypothetical protein